MIGGMLKIAPPVQPDVKFLGEILIATIRCSFFFLPYSEVLSISKKEFTVRLYQTHLEKSTRLGTVFAKTNRFPMTLRGSNAEDLNLPRCALVHLSSSQEQGRSIYCYCLFHFVSRNDFWAFSTFVI